MTPQQYAELCARKSSEIARLRDEILPVKVGAMAVAHYQDNFEKSGFVNDGLKPWKKSKRELSDRKTTRGGYGTLLSGQNHLFNSIRFLASAGQVVVSTDLVYAPVHNYGLRAGRGAGFQMPKRQFMGPGRELDDKINQKVEDELRKVLDL